MFRTGVSGLRVFGEPDHVRGTVGVTVCGVSAGWAVEGPLVDVVLRFHTAHAGRRGGGPAVEDGHARVIGEGCFDASEDGCLDASAAFDPAVTCLP